MTTSNWPMQQLVRYLVDLGRSVAEGDALVDEGRVLRRGLIAAAEAVDAEIALLVRDGTVVVSVGLELDTTLTDEDVARAVDPRDATLTIPGVGTYVVLTADLGPTEPGVLLLARTGDPFTSEEVALMRGMASAIVLSLRATRLIMVERAAREQSERDAMEALVDPLTRLPNRTLFLDRLTHATAVASRSGSRLAVLFIDMDGFKNVNDTLGHAVGDELLREVGARLKGALREQDTVARLGGDEFAVLVEEVIRERDVFDVAQRLAAAVAQPLQIQQHLVSIRASIGIAFGPVVGAPDVLLRNADLAMYRAKAEGVGTYVVFEQAMHTALTERMSMTEALRTAIANDELTLVYQPIADLRDGRIVGVETLLRWSHATLGVVPPSTFVPLAEEAGLIGVLGNWVLEEACRQLARWRASGSHFDDVNVAVNLSSHQLRAPGLAAHLERLLDAHELPPECVVLEITETAILSDEAIVLEQLQALRSIGVAIALDDFGTGYSSLSHLSLFPIDIVKIDRAFVELVAASPRHHALTNGIVRLARDLHLDVVAEGIETAAQFHLVKEMGCQYGQGYLLARPSSADVISSLLSPCGAVDLAVPLGVRT